MRPDRGSASPATAASTSCSTRLRYVRYTAAGLIRQSRNTPSLVGFGPRNRHLGEGASTTQTSNAKNTIGSLRRLIGRSFADPEVQDVESRYLSADMVDVQGQIGFTVNYLGEPTTFTVTQLYAMLLGRLRDTAAAEVKAVNDVVIAIPGWYTDAQRRAVLDAAEIAGLNVLRLVHDTTATALGVRRRC